ncbi:hypothetical protein A9Q99_10155 [Gammaproteobacteria bacterium 45_16_T64]|nr:hypothetical protein A9Q99_10155 [Gammaproteobacteria bacterium 45_16_T64]
MNDWDDLRFFLAVARNGTVSGAARLLEVNYTTVIRRLNSFEETMGFAVFERLPNGYELTRAGKELLLSAQTIEKEFFRLDKFSKGNDTDLHGTIRIATTDLLASIIMPEVSDFLLLHPHIDVEIISDSNRVDLDNREADIAIRITNQPPKHLEMRKIGNVGGSIYASKKYLSTRATLPENSQEKHLWIGWDDNITHDATSQLIEDFIPHNTRTICKVNSGTSLLSAITNGIGIGYLWDFIGDNDPQLERVYPDTHYQIDMWLLLSKDLYSTTRFQTVINYLENAFKVKSNFLQG